jgi:endogenous inhibitor of DNA gyrase (YacG/DUF329 family)
MTDLIRGRIPQLSGPRRDEQVRRDEVRIYGIDRILTMPVGTFECKTPDKPWYDRSYEGIQELWQLLLDELFEEYKASHAEWVKLGIAPDKPLQQSKAILSGYAMTEYECQQCGKAFISKWIAMNHPALCSDRCIAEHIRSLRIARYHNHPNKSELIRKTNSARAERSAKLREGKTCENCGEPVSADRSSRKFCSDKCRVAAHRARKTKVA